MKVHLDYRNPTATHCDVAIFLDGALCGTLTLRQLELVPFQQIIVNGINCTPTLDDFLATGNPDPAA